MTPSTTDSLALAATIARRPPTTEFVYEAVVDIGERVSIGQAPLGERFIVPIIGGVFKGADIEGVVLPGGADRQLVRRDGVRELDALYELQTHDGVVLTVHNRVLIDDPAGGPRYALSHISITAPQGSYDWLNRRTYVGTLDALRPRREAVLIRVYRLVGWGPPPRASAGAVPIVRPQTGGPDASSKPASATALPLICTCTRCQPG